MHAKHAIDHPKMDTDALIRGQVLHCLLLEPHRLNIDFVIEKDKLWNKTKLQKNGGDKEAWDLLKAEAEERLIPLVSHKLWLEALGMKESIQAHPLWQNVRVYGEKELTIISTLEEYPVRVRYDAKYGSIILDIKSCRFHLSNAKIQKVIAELSYHLSAAMYLEVGKSVGLNVDRFVWVFAENKPPYACRFIEATPKMLEIGLQEFYKCLKLYESCKTSGEYPGYPTDIEEIELPSWYEQREYLLGDDSEDAHESDS
jgi:hypothetical protein